MEKNVNLKLNHLYRVKLIKYHKLDAISKFYCFNYQFLSYKIRTELMKENINLHEFIENT